MPSGHLSFPCLAEREISHFERAHLAQVLSRAPRNEPRFGAFFVVHENA